LAQLFGHLTSKKVLAEVYINLNFPSTLISSEFYKAPLAGPIAEKTASDIIEALLGAVYRDKGMEPSQECVKKLFSAYIEHRPKTKAISSFPLPQQKISFPDLDILQRRISYHFKNVMLLQAAFIHPSAHGRNFEKLAFLGTRVLALGVAENAIDSNPIASEGLLTEKFIEKVNTPQLQQAFERWQLGYFLIRDEGGFGSLLPSPHTAPRMAAQTIQALLSAIYLDGDWIAAREMVQKLLFSDPPLTLELSSKERLRSRLRGVLKEQKGSAPQVYNSFPSENSPTLAIEEWPALGKNEGTNPEDIRWPRNLIHRSSPKLHEKIPLSADEEWPALTKKGC
jgi:ribonuclease-3